MDRGESSKFQSCVAKRRLGTLERNRKNRRSRIDRNKEIIVGHNMYEVHLIEPPNRMSSKMLEMGDNILEMENNHHMQGSL